MLSLIARRVLPAIVVTSSLVSVEIASAATLRARSIEGLERAIDAAGGGDTILLESGFYTPPPNGVWINDRAENLTIEAEEPGTVIFTGQGQRPLVRVINSTVEAGGVITFRGIVFRDGRDNQFQLSPALTLGRARAVIDDCDFQNNISTSGTTGGGAIVMWEGSLAIVNDSRFIQNVSDTEGGAIAVYDSALIVENSRFTANRVTLIENVRPTSAGGALALLNGSILIDRSRFERNLAGFAGGALYGFSSFVEPVDEPRGLFFVNNSTFVENGFGPASPTLPDPQQGGAIHIEDQIQLIIQGSRFINNVSEAGGAVTAYRSDVDIGNSLFRDNYGTGSGKGQGYAGQIGLLSGDLFSGDPNRPSGQLSIVDTLILCAEDRGDSQTGGGIFAEGDRNRSYGVGGLPIIGDAETNRAPVTIDRVGIIGCDTEGRGDLPGEGAGFELSHVDVVMTDSIIAGANAVGGAGSGGGGRIVFESKAMLDNVTIAFNSATDLGGGLVVQGSDLHVVDSVFHANFLSPGESEPEDMSFGAAIFASPIVDFNGFDMPMTGVVESTVFAENNGLAIFDEDKLPGPINDLRYNGNTFFEFSFEDRVYRNVTNSVTGITPQELNGVIIRRDDGVPDTDKARVDNVMVDDVPVTAALLVLPPTLPAVGAQGDDPALLQSFLLATWTGDVAEVDGLPVQNFEGFNGGALLTPTTVGEHILRVGDIALTAQVSGELFRDGFETGNLDRWDELEP